MTFDNNKLEIPVTDENAQAEQVALQVEELEDRAAPSAVWGT